MITYHLKEMINIKKYIKTKHQGYLKTLYLKEIRLNLWMNFNNGTKSF